MKTHIWDPLGVKDMTFHLENREDLRARMVSMSVRDAESGKAVYTGAKSWDDPIEDDFGGAGVNCSMSEYLRILKAVLDADEKLLGDEMWEEMFRPQLNKVERESMMQQLEDPEVNDRLGSLPLGAEKDWGWGGMLLQEDIEGERRKGTLLWGGVPNLSWVSLLLPDACVTPEFQDSNCLPGLQLIFPSGSIVRRVCADCMVRRCFLLEILGQYELSSFLNGPCMSGSIKGILDFSVIIVKRLCVPRHETIFVGPMILSLQIRRRVIRSDQ